MDHLQLVITSVLYLVGDLRHFPSYSVWPTPWLVQFPRLPFSDGGVEQPNHFTIYKWLTMNFLIVKFLLEAVLLTCVFPHLSKCICQQGMLTFDIYSISGGVVS